MAKPVVLDKDLSMRQVLERLGELVQLSVKRDGACVIVQRCVGELTILNPSILGSIPDDDIAAVLLDSWTEEEILSYLSRRAPLA